MHAEWTPRRRLGRSLALALLLLAASPLFAQDLTVLEANGEVKLRLDNLWQTPHSGMVVTLPAVVSTGTNGSVRLQQGETLIAVAANTAIELQCGLRHRAAGKDSFPRRSAVPRCGRQGNRVQRYVHSRYVNGRAVRRSSQDRCARSRRFRRNIQR